MFLSLRKIESERAARAFDAISLRKHDTLTLSLWNIVPHFFRNYSHIISAMFRSVPWVCRLFESLAVMTHRGSERSRGVSLCSPRCACGPAHSVAVRYFLWRHTNQPWFSWREHRAWSKAFQTTTAANILSSCAYQRVYNLLQQLDTMSSLAFVVSCPPVFSILSCTSEAPFWFPF